MVARGSPPIYIYIFIFKFRYTVYIYIHAQHFYVLQQKTLKVSSKLEKKNVGKKSHQAFALCWSLDFQDLLATSFRQTAGWGEWLEFCLSLVVKRSGNRSKMPAFGGEFTTIWGNLNSENLFRVQV